MRPRPRERSLRLRLCGLAPERAERRVSRKRVVPSTGVVGRARTSPRRGAPLGARRRDLPQILHALSFYSTFTQGTRRRASVAARAARRPGGVGLGRRGARGDDAWTRTLRMQRHLHVTRGDSRPSHGMTHFSAASFRSPQRSQTDRQILLDTQSAEGTSSSLRATHTVPPQLLHPSRRQTSDLLHERRMRERKQGDSNSCPGSSCGKAGRQDCAPVLSLSCTPGRLARLSELTSTFAAGWYAG